MTPEWVAKLDKLDFVWDRGQTGSTRQKEENALWDARLEKVAAYKAAHGDYGVPKRWARDPRLGSWVKNQWGLKRLLHHDKPCKGMTTQRAAKLGALRFAGLGS